MPLDHDAAIALAGGDVTDLGEAQNVEEVLPRHVADAESAAAEAEAKAAQSETAAVLGKLPAVQAAADRETARFARLRAAVTARRAERHRQAQRLRELDEAGTAARSHAEGLKAIHDATARDLDAIRELHAGIHKRIGAWNEGLVAIVERIGDLDPEPLLPGGEPRSSSANVWAATVDTLPTVVAQGQVITGINLEDPRGEGLPALIEAASRPGRRGDPSARLVMGENGVIVPVGADEFGHMQRRIDEGTIHELTPAQRKAYYRGEAIRP